MQQGLESPGMMRQQLDAAATDRALPRSSTATPRPFSVMNQCNMAAAATDGALSTSSRATPRPCSVPSERISTRLRTAEMLESHQVIQRGLVSMRNPIQGPGRQILDKSYFMGKLRARKQELQTEIDCMEREINRQQQKEPINMQLENEQETILKEVELMKSQLGDYNMLMEEVAGGMELKSLVKALKELKEKNDRRKIQSNELFNDRSQMGRATKNLEETFLSTTTELEQQFELEEPEKRKKILKEYQEHRLLNDDVERFETELQDLTSPIVALEEELIKAPFEKQKAVTLLEQLLTSKAKLSQIQREDVSNMHDLNMQMQASPQQAREAMLSKIRQEKQEITKLEDENKALEVEIIDLEENIVVADKAVCNLKGGKAEKFIEMQQKEQKIQLFLDSYETTCAEHKAAARLLQQKIVQALEQISEAEQFNILRHADRCCTNKNASYHSFGNESLHELTQEFQKQNKEFLQVQEMESKTSTELENSRQKVDDVTTLIRSLPSLDELQLESNSIFLGLEAQKSKREEERLIIQEKLSAQITVLELLEKRLKEDELHKNIATLNHDFHKLQQLFLKNQEEFTAKERELNYKPLIENIRFMVDQLNGEIVNRLKQ